MRVAAPPLPLPLLCCVVCWCQHGTCCSHPATPPPHLSWHRGLTAPPPLSPLCDCTHRSSSRGQTAGHTSTRDDDDTGRCVPMCAPHEVLMHGGHPGHTHAAIWQQHRCVCACVYVCYHVLCGCMNAPPPSPPPPLISRNPPLGSFFFVCSHSHSSRLLALRECAL